MAYSHKMNEDIAILNDYALSFVQRFPRFGKKSYKPGAKWTTINRRLSNRTLEGHLNHEYAIGTLGRWYPEYGIIDIDDRGEKERDEIREKLGLDESNSMLCSSESKDSYHILFRPTLNEKPPTTTRLYDDFKGFCFANKVEIYPQANTVVRLPFGKGQDLLDYEHSHLEKLKDKLYWFEKLDDFDISTVPKQQLRLGWEDEVNPDVEIPIFDKPKLIGEPKSSYERGREYYVNGLQAFGTRETAQFCVLYWMWRRNIPPQTAINATWSWIRRRHNGFSREYPKYQKRVKKHIIRQAQRIYENYDRGAIYPDTTHNNLHGFITKPDFEDIIAITKGSIPRMKFLFSLVKYAYPRRRRPYLNVHTDKLRQWSKAYQKYLNELDEKGVAKRGKAYRVGKFAKAINVKWPFRSSEEAVLFEGRAIDTLEDTVRLLYSPEDFKSILSNVGVSRQNIYHILKRIYEAERTPKM